MENNKKPIKTMLSKRGYIIVKKHFNEIVKGDVVRYCLDNIFSLNFILIDSLGGGGSESLLNDAQGKTYGQALLLMEIDLPNNLKGYINE